MLTLALLAIGTTTITQRRQGKKCAKKIVKRKEMKEIKISLLWNWMRWCWRRFLKNFYILMLRITNFNLHQQKSWNFHILSTSAVKISSNCAWQQLKFLSIDFQNFAYFTPVSSNYVLGMLTPGWFSISIEVEKFHFFQSWTKSFPSYSESSSCCVYNVERDINWGIILVASISAYWTVETDFGCLTVHEEFSIFFKCLHVLGFKFHIDSSRSAFVFKFEQTRRQSYSLGWSPEPDCAYVFWG